MTAASPTTSGSAPERDTTAGVPAAMASSGGRPKPSSRDGWTKATAPLEHGGEDVVGDEPELVHAAVDPEVRGASGERRRGGARGADEGELQILDPGEGIEHDGEVLAVGARAHRDDVGAAGEVRGDRAGGPAGHVDPVPDHHDPVALDAEPLDQLGGDVVGHRDDPLGLGREAAGAGGDGAVLATSEPLGVVEHEEVVDRADLGRSRRHRERGEQHVEEVGRRGHPLEQWPTRGQPARVQRSARRPAPAEGRAAGGGPRLLSAAALVRVRPVEVGQGLRQGQRVAADPGPAGQVAPTVRPQAHDRCPGRHRRDHASQAGGWSLGTP